MESQITITEREKHFFDYLNSLLKDERMDWWNPFGAIVWLQVVFDLSVVESVMIIKKWRENYNENGYEHLLA